MGLEMLQMQNKLAENLRNSYDAKGLEETRVRIFIGAAAIFLYLLIGAAVFVRIEGPVEEYEVEAYESFRTQWAKRLRRKGIGEDEVDKLFSNIRDAALHGVWREKNVSSDRNWTFGKAFFFAATLISTVGYGNISPQTPYGKVFTIVYCIVGIPLALTVISALSLRMRARPSAWLRERVNLRFAGSFHARHLQLIHLGALAGFVLIFAFIVPSLLFLAIEDEWTFIDAFFFCFVSLSTIGLGDYVPGDSPSQPMRGLYKIIVAVYLMFGLCCMMLLLGTLYDLPQFNMIRYFVTRSSDQPPNSNAAVGPDGEVHPINTTNGGYGAGAVLSDIPPGLPYGGAANPFQAPPPGPAYGYDQPSATAAGYGSNPFGAGSVAAAATAGPSYYQ